MIEISDKGIMLCLGEKEVTALSLDDGSCVWSKSLGSIMFADLHVLSQDKACGDIRFLYGKLCNEG